MTQSIPPTLLSLLQQYQKSQETRRALSLELESALSTHLSSSSSSTSSTSSDATTTPPDALSTCAAESIRPPNEAELGNVLRIGFEGLMEVKDEVEGLANVLELVMRRKDLAEVVRKVEEIEDTRLKTTLERDQLRRLAVLDPTSNFSQAIKDADQKRKELANQINEESQEIRAEIAELSLGGIDESVEPGEPISTFLEK